MVKKGFLIGLLFISSILFISLFPFNAYSQVSDVNYDFEQIKLFDDYSILPIHEVNLRHSNNNTGNFNGTHSFENDTDYINPSDWIDDSGVGCSANTFPSKLNHNKILELNDTSGNVAKLKQDFPSGVQVSGSIEYWLMVDNVVKKTNIHTENDVDGNFLLFYIRTSTFKHYDGAVFQTLPSSPVPKVNTWYNIRYDFECGAGGYTGLGADEYRIYINGLSYGVYDLRNPSNNVEELFFTTDGAEQDYKFYIDAIGYSWDTDYSINENYKPNIENVSYSTLKPDRYEFNLDNIGNAYLDHLGSDINGWSRTNPANVYVDNSDSDYDLPYQDYGVIIQPNVAGRKLYNDTLKINHDDVNITYALRYGKHDETTDTFTLHVYSLGNVELIRLQLLAQNSTGANLQYWNGAGYTYLIGVEGIDDSDNEYGFNLHIENFIVDLLYYINDTYIDFFSFSLLQNEYGIDTIEFLNIDPVIDGNYQEVRLSYVGIYQYNISLTREFGYIAHKVSSDWNSLKYNLFSYTSSNETIRIVGFGFGNEFYYQPGITYANIKGLNSYSTFLNLYEEAYHFYVFDAYLFFLTNTSITRNNYSFYIEGLRLFDGTTNLYPTYSDGNINSDNSYFYVRNSYLHYNLIADDSNLEFIDISFNIANVLSNQKTFLYKGNNFNLFGKQLRLNYADSTTTLVNISYGFKSERIFFAENKIFTTFDILITDDNLQDDYIGIGSFTSLILRSSLEHDISITTTNLLGALIPLLFIIVFPALTIAYSIDKVDKIDPIRSKILVPLLAIFSFVAFWFSEIELWMLFLLIISFGVLLFIGNKEVD